MAIQNTKRLDTHKQQKNDKCKRWYTKILFYKVGDTALKAACSTCSFSCKPKKVEYNIILEACRIEPTLYNLGRYFITINQANPLIHNIPKID